LEAVKSYKDFIGSQIKRSEGLAAKEHGRAVSRWFFDESKFWHCKTLNAQKK